jgi:superfamily II DNA/RNA helicase
MWPPRSSRFYVAIASISLAKTRKVAKRDVSSRRPFESRLEVTGKQRFPPFANTTPLVPLIQNLIIPDLWQQEAVRALRDGRDVVVHAPTGAGKTYIFELFLPSLRGQAVFTVPTRALANDKLAEWQARGWDVGIATGDLALRPEAKVLVATLETQKGKFLQRLGPRLLVIDEYQMIGDPVRGVNYELALALAPAETQLLLLSGSVGNPKDVVEWLRRIGRDAVLVSHDQRPTPLDEVDLEALPNKASTQIRGRWPRFITNALRADLGPVLLFAPRRQAAEELARELASALPPDAPLNLTPEQTALAGPRLAKLLARRVAYHHSGLSFAQRAGIIEPLAKAGQLRAVVATMGLAAGINFSMRSVAITDTRYKAGNFETQVRPDEFLQMYGRAGRRGLDEAGFALISDRPPRLHDAHPLHLKRSAQVDWPALLSVMRAAFERGEDPFAAALDLNSRLFTAHPIPLGVEHSRATGPMPCGLVIDMERARFARRGIIEMRNSRAEWEPRPEQAANARLGDALVFENERWKPALSLPRILTGLGPGSLCKLDATRGKRYGRELPLGMRREGRLTLAPWLRRVLKRPHSDGDALVQEILATLPELLKRSQQIRAQSARTASAPGSKGKAGAQDQEAGKEPAASLVTRGEHLFVRLDYSSVETPAWIDRHGKALLAPPERRELPPPCRGCPELAIFCEKTEIVMSPTYAWRRLGLIEMDGEPTRRGILFSFFHNGEGLAVAAALEDQAYPVEELVFDLANLRAGPRFAEDESPLGGRLGALCQQTYDRADLPGYLEMGVPPQYGAGASEAVREIIVHGIPRAKLLTETLRQGDIERAIIEWRSLLRHIVSAPDYDFERWRELKEAARRYIEASISPAMLALPPLTASQQRRADK